MRHAPDTPASVGDFSGFSEGTSRRRRVLVAYSIASTFVPTTMEYLRAFKAHSRFDVDYVHASHDAVLDLDLDAYDAVFNNYCVRHCFPEVPSKDYVRKLTAYRGVKIMAVQDEYNRTETLRRAVEEIGFDIVLTCVPQRSLDYVYPRARFPRTSFETVFTGYAPSGWTRPLRYPRMADRPLALGYRGRDIGGQYGRLGFEKYEIGRRMKEICAAAGLAHDIAVDEDSRIYGEAWFDFIGSCRAMLGSESGSNIFDFDGSIDQLYKTMTEQAGGVRPSYEQFRPFIEQRESEIDMGQISPRVFECALMRTAMVLFRGRYSDALEADAHYIPLEKDFSNAYEVLARLEDLDALEAMTQRAHDHLIVSGRFGYPAFIRRVDDLVDQTAATKPAPARKTKTAPDAPRPAWPATRPTPTPLPTAAYYLGNLSLALASADLEGCRKMIGEVESFPEMLDPQIEAAIARCKAAAARLDYWTRLARPDASVEEIEAVPLGLAQTATTQVWEAIGTINAAGAELGGGALSNLQGDLARADRGARIVASSPFFPAPNDPAGLLVDDFDYAAALDGPAPHWFEIDFGEVRLTRGAVLLFYDRANRATDFRISVLDPGGRDWRTASLTQANDRQMFAARWTPCWTRRVKFEASGFAGQQRLLLRRFCVIEAPADGAPAPNEGRTAAPGRWRALFERWRGRG